MTILQICFFHLKRSDVRYVRLILYYDNGFSKLVDRRRVGTKIDTGNKAADVIVSVH